jgi:uncharacterized protein YodC (DUF2158 family)
MKEFNAGDVVVLKSGGPKMTITGIDDKKYASCVWFDNKMIECRSMFSIVLLDHFEEPEIGFTAF